MPVCQFQGATAMPSSGQKRPHTQHTQLTGRPASVPPPPPQPALCTAAAARGAPGRRRGARSAGGGRWTGRTRGGPAAGRARGRRPPCGGREAEIFDGSVADAGFRRRVQTWPQIHPAPSAPQCMARPPHPSKTNVVPSAIPGSTCTATRRPSAIASPPSPNTRRVWGTALVAPPQSSSRVAGSSTWRRGLCLLSGLLTPCHLAEPPRCYCGESVIGIPPRVAAHRLLLRLGRRLGRRELLEPRRQHWRRRQRGRVGAVLVNCRGRLGQLLTSKVAGAALELQAIKPVVS